jgi:hypothetical protein
VTIGDAVRERLLDITPLTTLVGTRVYPLVLQQNERRAAVRYQVIDGNALQHLRGPAGIQTTRVQIDSYVSWKDSATPLTDVEAVADAVHGDGLGENASGVFGFIGDLGGSPAQMRILNARRVMKRGPLYEYDGDVVRLRVQQDYLIDWKAL